MTDQEKKRKLIQGMTNWQNHQWLKSGVTLANLPDLSVEDVEKFANMGRRKS